MHNKIIQKSEIPLKFYFPLGTGGQYLIVHPKRKLVIVNRVDTGKRVRRGYSLETIIWFLLRKNSRENLLTAC